MGHTMIRTANSSVFVEGRDFSCALVDARAELVASANFDPSHLSAMALTVEYAMLYFGPDKVRPGDVYLVNDPFRGGGHLPDITLIRPVFIDDRLLGFAVNRAHHIDIGGMAVAGFPGTARSMFQEGLRIPPVRWFDGGVENRDVMELIALNVRFPKDQVGDFLAQLASTRIAEQRLLKLAGKYGADSVVASMEASKDHSERLMRAIFSELPDGSYEFDEFMEDDGVTDRPYRIHVTLTVEGDHVTIDYTGTSPQAAGPINSSYGNTLSGTFNAMLQMVGPDVRFNEGCFRPITVIAPRGCLLNPTPPAPCFGGVTEGCIRIIDVVLGALAPIAPNRVGAGSYGTCVNFSGGGFDVERRQDFGYYFFCEGGWGACAWRDGWNCTPNPTSNFNDYSVEWVESTLPLLYREARLNTDSGGPGRYRGGVGTIRTVELLSDDVEINGLGERMIVPPYGLEGGYPGGCSGLRVRFAGSDRWQTIAEAYGAVSPSKFNGYRAGRGDRFSIVTGGGGGHGSPLERPAEEVVEDVIDGFVSHERARAVYGVAVIERDDGRLGHDAAETARIRAEMLGSGGLPLDNGDLIFQSALDRSVSERADPRVEAEIARVEEIIASGRRAEAATGRSGEGEGKGKSLASPFLNERAMRFWDAHSLELWAFRHGLDLTEGAD
jgi:N-methylhydantoinase B/oxoprolinase/acetone carboxylase alpha subunit